MLEFFYWLTELVFRWRSWLLTVVGILIGFSLGALVPWQPFNVIAAFGSMLLFAYLGWRWETSA